MPRQRVVHFCPSAGRFGPQIRRPPPASPRGPQGRGPEVLGRARGGMRSGRGRGPSHPRGTLEGGPDGPGFTPRKNFERSPSEALPAGKMGAKTPKMGQKDHNLAIFCASNFPLYIYTHGNIYTYIYTNIYIYIHQYIYIYIHQYIYIYTPIYIYTNLYIYTPIYIYTSVYIHIHQYISTGSRPEGHGYWPMDSWIYIYMHILVMGQYPCPSGRVYRCKYICICKSMGIYPGHGGPIAIYIRLCTLKVGQRSMDIGQWINAWIYICT